MVYVQWLSKCSFRPQADRNRIGDSMCPLACTETSLPWPRTQILLIHNPIPSAAQAQFKIDPQTMSCISFTPVLHRCNSIAFSSFVFCWCWTVTYPLGTESWESAEAPSVPSTHQEHTTCLRSGSNHPCHSAHPCLDLAHVHQHCPG